MIDVEEASGPQDLDDFANYGQASDLYASTEGMWQFYPHTWPNTDSYQKGPTSVSIQFSPAQGDQIAMRFDQVSKLSDPVLQLGNYG